MKHLIIIGVGGFARETYWHAQESRGYGEEWDLKGYLDGDVLLPKSEYEKLMMPVLGDIDNYEIEADDVFISTVADPAVRYKLINRILNRGGKFINVIHKTVEIHGSAKIGTGNVMAPYSYCKDHAAIGDFTLLHARSGLSHDSKVGNYATLCGNVAVLGFATVGNMCFLADSARALPYSKIEDNVYVGVSSVVFKKAKAGSKVFGNPAMPV